MKADGFIKCADGTLQPYIVRTVPKTRTDFMIEALQSEFPHEEPLQYRPGQVVTLLSGRQYKIQPNGEWRRIKEVR